MGREVRRRALNFDRYAFFSAREGDFVFQDDPLEILFPLVSSSIHPPVGRGRAARLR